MADWQNKVIWKNIVVGVDGSDSSRKALRWARDVAVQHDGELTVLLAWLPVPQLPAGPAATYTTHDEATQPTEAEQRLLATIREVVGENPPVVVRPVVKNAGAAKALIDASADADLVVVGSRGIGGFAGMLLGSVSQHVAAHAACTVVVVR